MDSKNFAIGVLGVTAVVLFVGLALVNQVPQAHAFGQTAAGGDYLVATGQVTESNEIVYVVDAATGRLLSYIFDANRGTIQRLDGVELEEIVRKAPKGRRDHRRR